MKKRLLYLLLASSALTVNLRADEQVRTAQTELKNLGFFYGNVNGENTPETTAAVRRYQIRNGLEVTGTLNAETLQALGQAGDATPAPPPPVQVEKPAPTARPARPPSVEESDRRFLQKEGTKRPPAANSSRPPSPPTVARGRLPDDPTPDPGYADVFAGSPYAAAPRGVQSSTLRRAQTLLAQRGFYRAPIDGVPDSDTEEAILSYQRSVRLPLTGQLDLETLSRLQLLPGRSPVPLKGFLNTAPDHPPQPKVYRGILVN